MFCFYLQKGFKTSFGKALEKGIKKGRRKFLPWNLARRPGFSPFSPSSLSPLSASPAFGPGPAAHSLPSPVFSGWQPGLALSVADHWGPLVSDRSRLPREAEPDSSSGRTKSLLPRDFPCEERSPCPFKASWIRPHPVFLFLNRCKQP